MDRSNSKIPTRTDRERYGRRAELIAAAFLMLKGHRILARRHRTPFGEIDIIAKRGRRLAFVEVKYRATSTNHQSAISPQQAARIARAATHWLAAHPALGDSDMGFDAIFIAPWRRPILLRDALQPVGTSGRTF
ncbi:MAG: YraN family protein [Hyphomicrobiaceae bacterium]|nr:YraN family protein [Hyphomicrobiaceae bacterium]